MNSEVNECKNKSFIKQHLFFHKHEGNLQQKQPTPIIVFWHIIRYIPIRYMMTSICLDWWRQWPWLSRSPPVQTEYYLLKGRGVMGSLPLIVACLGPHFMRRAEVSHGKVSSNPHHWWLDLFGCIGMQQRKLFTKNFFTLFRKELLCLTALPPVKRKNIH